MDYKGKTAVITGGASGVGRAMGARFLREGMKVVLSDVESGPLQATVDELLPLGSVSGVTCDVSKFEQVENLASEAVARHGKVHLLCNNAGVSAYEDVPAWDLPINDWRWVFDVNVMGVVHGIKAFVPGMIAHGEEGAVMNTSSGNGGLLVLPFTPSYSASKAAVSSITETLYHQLKVNQTRLRAHVLYPGPHVVASNIFTAYRNRLPGYERGQEQAAPYMTIDDLKTMYEGMGRHFETTTPEEVADHAWDGLQSGSYFINPTSDELIEQMRARFEAILAKQDPPG